ncbi:MAG TPA: serine--tRNA ligase, partial [Anaerolineae bacterium]|nr:serine--tRNA ligase [Anaerolineae bacterium]
MLDLNFIREHPDLVKEALVKLNATAPVDEILALDEERRGLLSEVESMRHRRNVVSKEIGRMKDGQKRQALIAEMRELGKRIKALEARLREV